LAGVSPYGLQSQPGWEGHSKRLDMVLESSTFADWIFRLSRQ
jgi:hypothetical protein